MAERVYWWHAHPDGACGPVVVAVFTTGLSRAVSLTKRAGFHGLKKQAGISPPPDWVVDVPTANPGRVCWCPDDCTVAENWQIEG